MTKINIPVRQVPETPEETEFLDQKSWEKPQSIKKPTVGMLYQEHKLVIGILIGCLFMGFLAAYFQGRNFGILNDNITRNQKLGSVMENNTQICKNLIEENKKMLAEYKDNNTIILSQIAEKITRKTSKVVEDKEVQP